MANKPKSPYVPPKTPIGSSPFQPVIVERCEVGKTYVYSKFGVVKCTAIGDLETPSVGKIETVSLKQVGTKNSPVVHIPSEKIASSGIRQLADAKTMDAVLKKITHRITDNKLFSPKVAFNEAGVGGLLASSNPYVLAEIVCRSFGREQEIEGRTYGAVLYGNMALEYLAAEYATVKGMELDEALCLMTDKSGKHEKKLHKNSHRKAELALTA